jgi:small conductance mechanosensitive channel
MNMNVSLATLEATLTTVGLRILGALVLYIIGRWLIGLAVRLLQRGLARQKFDPTLMRFLGSIVSVTLNITLIIAILGYFGVQTTSFAALLAGAGLAIGAAWSGLLSNFAAGVFLIVLRPFKAGDFITAGGITGTVEEVGLFVTTMHTPDNIRTYVGNNKIFSDTIQNFSANPHRRVELTAQISSAANPLQVVQALKERIAKIANVLQSPEPDVVISSFTLIGPVLAIRPYCANANYWQVYFDTNMAIREVLGSSAFPAPLPVYGVTQVAPTTAASGNGPSAQLSFAPAAAGGAS